MLSKAVTKGSDKFWTLSHGVSISFLLLSPWLFRRGQKIHFKQKFIIDYSTQASHSPDRGQALCCPNTPAVRILLLCSQLLSIKKETECKTTKAGPQQKCFELQASIFFSLLPGETHLFPKQDTKILGNSAYLFPVRN